MHRLDEETPLVIAEKMKMGQVTRPPCMGAHKQCHEKYGGRDASREGNSCVALMYLPTSSLMESEQVAPTLENVDMPAKSRSKAS